MRLIRKRIFSYLFCLSTLKMEFSPNQKRFISIPLSKMDESENAISDCYIIGLGKGKTDLFENANI